MSCCKFHRVCTKLKGHVNKDNSDRTHTIQSVNGLHKAEVVIIRVMQHTSFPEQMKILKQGTDTPASEARRLKRNDPLLRLDPEM